MEEAEFREAVNLFRLAAETHELLGKISDVRVCMFLVVVAMYLMLLLQLLFVIYLLKPKQKIDSWLESSNNQRVGPAPVSSAPANSKVKRQLSRSPGSTSSHHQSAVRYSGGSRRRVSMYQSKPHKSLQSGIDQSDNSNRHRRPSPPFESVNMMESISQPIEIQSESYGSMQQQVTPQKVAVVLTHSPKHAQPNNRKGTNALTRHTKRGLLVRKTASVRV